MALYKAGTEIGTNIVDIWRLNSTQSMSSGEATIDTSWTRTTNRGRVPEGNAMTESSGIFTFPSTGKWLVISNFYQSGSAATHWKGIKLKNADDETLQMSYSHGDSSGSNHDHSHVALHTFLDVTDTTSNACKVKFVAHGGATTTWVGGDDGASIVLFLRLMGT